MGAFNDVLTAAWWTELAYALWDSFRIISQVSLCVLISDYVTLECSLTIISTGLDFLSFNNGGQYTILLLDWRKLFWYLFLPQEGVCQNFGFSEGVLPHHNISTHLGWLSTVANGQQALLGFSIWLKWRLEHHRLHFLNYHVIIFLLIFFIRTNLECVSISVEFRSLVIFVYHICMENKQEKDHMKIIKNPLHGFSGQKEK